MALAARAISEPSLGFAPNLELTRAIVQAVRVPVMADGEDGFGPPERIAEVVRAYLDAGVAGINLEDQVLPPSTPKSVVPRAVMVDKIRAARTASADVVLNARTDALNVAADRAAGLAEAIERANLYLAAGADLAFVIGVNTVEEVKRVVGQVRGPVSMAAGLPTNIGSLSLEELRALGVARVSLPTVAVLSALRAMKQTLALVSAPDGLRQVAAQGLLSDMREVAAVLQG